VDELKRCNCFVVTDSAIIKSYNHPESGIFFLIEIVTNVQHPP
jgi:hypothetical protein